jgi:predicted DNA-binding protein (MmcQ/YjbR family)
MNHTRFNTFCSSLPHTTYVMQWGGSHVWKVGGKVFAIGGWDKEHPAITFKVTPMSFEMLKDQIGLRPAPYLASRGFKWIQHYAETGLSDEDLCNYIRQSHRIVVLGLSKKMQKELAI